MFVNGEGGWVGLGSCMISGMSDGRVVCDQHCSLVKQQVSFRRQGMLTLDVAPDSIHTCCESVSPFLSLISHSNGTDINNSIFPYPLSVVCCLLFCCCWCFWGDVCVGIGWVLCVLFFCFCFVAVISELRNIIIVLVKRGKFSSFELLKLKF